MRPPLTLQWFIDLIGKIPAITCFCLDLSEFESESSAVFLSTLENQRNFLTARNPLLPVELEVENQMKRDMFEFRGISGRKDDPSTIEPHGTNGSYHISDWHTLFFFMISRDLVQNWPCQVKIKYALARHCSVVVDWMSSFSNLKKKQKTEVLRFIVYSSL